MEYRLLGPLEVVSGSQRIEIAAGRQRALLILLALQSNRHVSAQVLLDELWHGVPPGNGHRAVHVLVSRLRRSLAVDAEAEQIVSANHGYLLRAGADQLDVLRFDRLVDEGRGRLAAGDPQSALARLDEALALWRGEALADAAYEPFAQPAIRRLDELRALAREERLEALLGVGDHATAVADATALVHDQPMRMRTRRLLALALYRCARHADALDVIRDARMTLDATGLEPDPALRSLETAILTQHDQIAPPAPVTVTSIDLSAVPAGGIGAAGAGGELAGRPTRKTVTVLCCGLADSATFGADAERVSDVLEGYLEAVRRIAGEHGGTVERPVGDAVMVVFGVPVLHEDDAQRATHAAIAIRAAIAAAGLASRIGVITGEVLAAADGSIVGDPVGIAARLAQAAATDEILIGVATRRLVSATADVEALSRRVASNIDAVRLVAVRAPDTAAPASPFVGRDGEVALITSAWCRVATTGCCELVTIVGEPGIGKSRLVSHALESVDALVVTGACLPYGEGITYWPVVRILRQLGVTPREPAAADAVASLLDATATPRSADDIAAGFRRVLEQAAEAQPIAVVFEDLQWAEPTLLDLIESVALLASDARLLLVCIARAELLDQRPSWPVSLTVAPLTGDDAHGLVPAALPAEQRAAIVAAAAGNPLFVEQLVAVVATGEPVTSPSLAALLAARVDQLAPDERRVLECGAVEGELFHVGSARTLAADDLPVMPRLAALVRRGLIRPTRPEVAGEDAFQFRHLLLRDAAYAALSKSERADLHRQLADWLIQRAEQDHDELIGYHQAQAHRYRAELGLPRDGELAAAASSRLAASGRRAHLRADFGAARSLLERALKLEPPDTLDVRLELDLIDVLFWSGDGAAALAHADQLAERAASAGDRIVALTGAIKAAMIRTWIDPASSLLALAALLDEVMPEIEAAGDDVALYTAWMARADLAFVGAQADDALAAYDEAARHAPAPSASLLEWQAVGRIWGTTPASDILAWLDATAAAGEGGGWQAGFRAYVLGMLGRIDEARAVMRAERDGRGTQLRGVRLATALAHEAEFELVAGKPEAAIDLLTDCCRLLEAAGEIAILSTRAATLAIALCDVGRYDEAAGHAARAAELCQPGDVFTELSLLFATARLAAHRSQLIDAEELLRHAIAVAATTSAIDAQAFAAADLAEVLHAQGRTDEAVEELTSAAQLYDRKGNRTAATRTLRRLAQIDVPSTSTRLRKAPRRGA